MQEVHLSGLSNRTADPALLTVDSVSLPADLGLRPEASAEDEQSRLVSAGVALTATSLVGGGALAIAGVIDLISSGGVTALLLLCVGLLLVGTHWGWVHVAQTIADGRAGRDQQGVERARAAWLAQIAPYPRWEVRTHARASDAAIVIELICFSPVPASATTFAFTSTVQQSEAVAADAAAAAVTERVAELRRTAAMRTGAAREAWTGSVDAAEHARRSAAQDAAALEAAVAGSRALAEHLNAQDPPLPE